MIELIKEVGVVVKDMPDMAMYALVAILFYKVLILGSWFGVAKLVITKFHDWAVKPREVIKKVDISGDFITCDGTYTSFVAAIKDMKDKINSRDPNHRVGKYTPSSHQYLYSCDVEFMRAAINEKFERENKK
jgi:hypothetical protein